ncbi:hypothetical protein [Acrocarpospora pleiomorpha]|uniref:hypothetical protein n=1 Tax=Acrocarpospora pleiomorpha TaxID=90975 RepID=UPI0031D126A6
MDADVEELRTRVRRFADGDVAAVTSAEAASVAARVAASVELGQSVGVRRLQALGMYHLARFQALDAEMDLKRAMALFQALYPVRPDLVPEGLHSLLAESVDGSDLLRRALDEEDAELLDAAIEVLTGQAEDGQAAVLANLGTGLVERFHLAGDVDDLDAAVNTFRRAVDAAAADDPQRPAFLSYLGSALRERFESRGVPADLDAAVVAHEQAAAAQVTSRALRAVILHNLGNVLVDRFRQRGSADDVATAIRVLRAAIAMTEDGDSRRVSIHNSIAVASRARFDRWGDADDLDAARDELLAATSLPGTTFSLVNAWNNLGTTMAARFETSGDLADLDTAITHLDRAARLADGTPSQADVLMNLGNTLLTRYEQRGADADLEEAIRNLTRAVERSDADDPALAVRLSNLGLGYGDRFEHTGDPADLAEAVSACERAVELSVDHAQRADMLSNLGNLVGVAAGHSGALLDLDAAVAALVETTGSLPEGHPDGPRYQNNLGLAWLARFERTSLAADLDAAVEALRVAVARVRPDSPERSGYLCNLGSALRTRHFAVGDPADLDAAIVLFEQALDALPEGHRDRNGMLGNLGSALTERALRTPSGGDDRRRALACLRRAAMGNPEDSPSRALQEFHLGTALTAAGATELEISDGLAALAKTVAADGAAPSLRLSAARTAGRAAHASGEHSLALAAYRVALLLLPRVSGRRLRRTDQEFHLGEVSGLVGDAAGCAIGLGRHDEALELLEQGRCVLWNQQVSSYGLAGREHAADPVAAQRLKEILSLLDEDALRPAFSRGGMRQVSAVLRERHALVRRGELLDELKELLVRLSRY